MTYETARCPARRREPRKEKDGHWDYRGTWLCVLAPDHEGDHRSERIDSNHRGRKFTDDDIERSTAVEKKWRRLGQPQPPGSIVGYEAFEAWVLRQTDDSGSPAKAIVTTNELYEVRDLYLTFSEFAFDVETHANRPVRMLQAGRRVLSRHGGETTPCLACGKPIPSRRRAYCSDLCRKAADKDKPALDTQTNEVWCLSLAGPGISHVIPMGHPDKRQQLDRAEVFDALKPLFFSDRRKINQNVGFDLLSIAKYYGEIPPPPYADVMVMVFLLNENLRAYNLEALARDYIRVPYVEKLGEEAYNVGWQRAMKYSIKDAKMAWMLWWRLHGVLEKKPKLGSLFDLEMKVLRVLLHMRQQGVYVDVEGFRTLRPKLEAQLAEIGTDIRSMVGHEINLNSTQQLGKWLYDERRLHPPFRTESGLRSTAAPALKRLAHRDKAPRRVLEYKDVNKLLSTYVVGFMPHIGEDSRIRASFNQAVAKTGRLSCSAPNLQNIPARHKEGFEATMIRQLFVAPPGHKLIVGDYSQIELRILAHQTRDEKLIYAYTHDLDLHTQTASLIWRIPQDQVNSEQRSIAKNSNFNFAFEGGPGRVMEMSGIPEREAREVYAAWHRAYPGVKRWGESVKSFCRTHGYVETLYGRKRRLEWINSADWGERGYAERQAVNHPIQGTAADIAKIAIVRIHEALQGLDAHLVLQIHDEFVIECVEAEVQRALPLVREAMEDIRRGDRPVLDVPLVANINVGDNWAECK